MEEAGLISPRCEELAASRSALAAAPRPSQADYAGDVVSVPSIPDADWADLSIRTVRAYDRNFWYSFDFTWASFGFWGTVFLVSTINRFVEFLKVLRARPATRRRQSSGGWTWIRRQLILSVTFGKHCQEPVGWATLPPRLESCIIFAYLLMSTFMCFPGYDLFDNNEYWATTGAQLARYIADRTAVLSIANVPLLWLFAARNDPLLWLTGFSYASFNRFHRWVARMAFVFALVHSIVWTYDYIYFYGVATYYAAYEEVWWWTGVIATVIMATLLPASVYWLRTKHYDFFLIVHIVLSIIFLITLYFHIQVYEHFFDGFIWPCVAIWSLDRLLCIVRIVYTSVIPLFTKGVKATATFDIRSDIVRLDVTDFFPPNTSISPGLYYYVYLPASLKGWESHPFTLCSWNRSVDSIPVSPAPLASPHSSLDIEAAKKVPALRSRELASAQAVSHSFLIRPYAGFTQRLRDRIVAAHEARGLCEVTVLLEGPYGCRLDLSRYSDVLILAAGSGIVTAISHAHYLLANGRTEVHLTWVVPQRWLVEDVCKNELSAILGGPRLHMTVYLTGKSQEMSEESAASSTIEFHAGRPDIFAVMQQARALQGRLGDYELRHTAGRRCLSGSCGSSVARTWTACGVLR
ncbi:hypothetical protein AMS68_008054 [Peltaster fructicola]|uniref:FAD-binding FR-type domain-containing protein n=1 Tax=Peltaster fructicola TaxID=286661 RepID=A0A6H0Y651_9PEZI|nr:hypothetical protein AMS68_008054 [Peltaster fructicola]